MLKPMIGVMHEPEERPIAGAITIRIAQNGFVVTLDYDNGSSLIFVEKILQDALRYFKAEWDETGGSHATSR